MVSSPPTRDRRSQSLSLRINEFLTPTAESSSSIGVPANLIFDSNRTYKNFYDGFGREDWDAQKKVLYGPKGEGEWSSHDKTFTISRTNTGGRFVILIKQYFYQSKTINVIPPNLYGRNPRHFKITFKARAVSGKHRVTIAFRDIKTKDWIAEPSFEIDNMGFRPQIGSVAVAADQGFTVEIHSWSFQANTVLQIVDLLIEEVQ